MWDLSRLNMMALNGRKPGMRHGTVLFIFGTRWMHENYMDTEVGFDQADLQACPISATG